MRLRFYVAMERAAATAPIQALAWEPPYAASAVLESKKQTNKQTNKQKKTKNKQTKPQFFSLENSPMRMRMRIVV